MEEGQVGIPLSEICEKRLSVSNWPVGQTVYAQVGTRTVKLSGQLFWPDSIYIFFVVNDIYFKIYRCIGLNLENRARLGSRQGRGKKTWTLLNRQKNITYFSFRNSTEYDRRVSYHLFNVS